MFCETAKKHFDDYTYTPVAWSGDRLPTCPHCGKSPYDADFEQSHKAAKRQGGAE